MRMLSWIIRGGENVITRVLVRGKQQGQRRGTMTSEAGSYPERAI